MKSNQYVPAPPSRSQRCTLMPGRGAPNDKRPNGPKRRKSSTRPIGCNFSSPKSAQGGATLNLGQVPNRSPQGKERPSASSTESANRGREHPMPSNGARNDPMRLAQPDCTWHGYLPLLLRLHPLYPELAKQDITAADGTWRSGDGLVPDLLKVIKLTCCAVSKEYSTRGGDRQGSIASISSGSATGWVAGMVIAAGNVVSGARRTGPLGACASLTGSSHEQLHASSHGTRGSLTAHATDADETIRKIIFLQDLLFTPTVSRTVSNAPDRSTGGVAISDKSSREMRKRHWRVLLQKSTGTFPLLVTAVRSGLAAVDVRVAAALFSLLYNILHSIPASRQRKAAQLCAKLGLVKACVSVVQAYGRPLVSAGSAGRDHVSCSIRACEAAGLLCAMVGRFDASVPAVVRLSRTLSGLLRVAEICGVAVEKQFAKYRTLSGFECGAQSKSGSRDYAHRGHVLSKLRRLMDASSFGTHTFLCFSLTLFALLKTALGAQQLGPPCVALCAQMIAHLVEFLVSVYPHLVLVLVGTREKACVPVPSPLRSPEGGATSEVGMVVAGEGRVPAWIETWVAHLETVLFWATALLQRVSALSRSGDALVEAAAHHHAFRSFFILIGSGKGSAAPTVAAPIPSGIRALYASFPPSRRGSHHSLTGPPVVSQRRMEVIIVALSAVSALFKCSRRRALREMSALGGLATFVEQILALSHSAVLNTSSQWGQLYMRLCALYAISALPSSSSKDKGVNMRLPRQLSMNPVTSSKVSEGERAGRTVQEEERETEEGDRGCDLGWLLPIDDCPGYFSPELLEGKVAPTTILPPLSETQFPWTFTDAGPPPAHFRRREGEADTLGGMNEGMPTQRSHPPEALHLASEEQRIQIMKHHIRRLKFMEEDADDADEGSFSHHYNVVYERPNGDGEAELNGCPFASPAAPHPHGDGLRFASNFESGNLQRVIKVDEDEYDLVLSADTSTNCFVQWFCFSISGYRPNAKYRFNILNMEKDGSSFNEGQRPLMLHVPQIDTSPPEDAYARCDGWQRVGEDVLYFQNPYVRPPRQTNLTMGVAPGGVGKAVVDHRYPFASPTPTEAPTKKPHVIRKSCVVQRPVKKNSSVRPTAKKMATDKPAAVAHYYTLTFKVHMPSSSGTVYLANCFPYTYTELREYIVRLQRVAPSSKCMVQSLCQSLGGLPVPILTVTATRKGSTGESYTSAEIRQRPVCFVSSRVHPGESTASWIMEGLLDWLLQQYRGVPAEEGDLVSSRSEGCPSLLERYVFKIVPMINVDGVIMGNHRCSLAGVDLNRDYAQPRPHLNPVVYSIKRLLRHMIEKEQRHVIFYADLHGHSRAKNFFMYGCTRATARLSPHTKRGGNPSKGKTAATMKGSTWSELPSMASEKGGEGHRVELPQHVAPEKLYPILLGEVAPVFATCQSSFAVPKCKWNTGRVVMYREFGIRMSYTLEGTMMGGVAADCCMGGVCQRLVRDPDVVVATPRVPGPPDFLPLQHMPRAVEAHYTEETYRVMGACVVVGLHVMQLMDFEVSRSLELGKRETESTACDAVRRAWRVLDASGCGPKLSEAEVGALMSEEATATDSGAVSVGSYVLATRADRRSHPLSGCERAASNEGRAFCFPFGVQDGLNLAQRQSILHDLLYGAQRMPLLGPCDVIDHGEDGEVGDDGDDDSDSGPQKSDWATATVRGSIGNLLIETDVDDTDTCLDTYQTRTGDAFSSDTSLSLSDGDDVSEGIGEDGDDDVTKQMIETMDDDEEGVGSSFAY